MNTASLQRRLGGALLSLLLVTLLTYAPDSRALGQASYVQFSSDPGDFALVAAGAAANLYLDSGDFAGVALAAGNLQADIARVSAVSPQLVKNGAPSGAHVVLIGTIGRSRMIDQLIAEHKLDVTAIEGK